MYLISCCCGWRCFSLNNTIDRFQKRMRDQEGLGGKAVRDHDHMEVSRPYAAGMFAKSFIKALSSSKDRTRKVWLISLAKCNLMIEYFHILGISSRLNFAENWFLKSDIL